MRQTSVSNFFKIIFALVVVLFVSANVIYASDQTEDLKAQIEALHKRIAELENQAAQNNQSGQTQLQKQAIPAIALSGTWDPILEMQYLRQQMNRMFEDSFFRGNGVANHLDVFDPQVDIKQEKKHYVLTMDLPGMEKESINVEVKAGTLIVSGERSASHEKKDDKFFRQERSFGKFIRTIPLAEDVNENDVQAGYQNGVLEIKIGRIEPSKQKPAQGKKIKIN